MYILRAPEARIVVVAFVTLSRNYAALVLGSQHREAPAQHPHGHACCRDPERGRGRKPLGLTLLAGRMNHRSRRLFLAASPISYVRVLPQVLEPLRSFAAESADDQVAIH